MENKKIINFPDYNAPLSEEAQKRFDKLIADIEKDSELYASYVFDGPNPNPLIRRYQENLVKENDEMLDIVLKKQ